MFKFICCIAPRFVVAAVLAAPLLAGAQSTYPSRPIVMIVPQAAGGTNDIVGRLVSQKQLLAEVWGPAYSTESHYLRVYMAQLRRKLEPHPASPVHLLTEPGMGYRFEP